ncbi:bifunctional 4-hydroxy-2-oxoglutarate aldolase/2-dehydro-3-deoxy-phosphogluconate aldolase [Tolumonas osonensis]|uniref:2-dehydro-3-deoxy-phosphogluconate aldolase n=1 Tax=Tolumonas osonensis TaxID=675874 RepID=A0A841GI45_9GAMM|nr:bifunctional 4-hydroxy-2-oxoglutarate aldolase/2-dehydro-3-deoxy-phosphogluconate aldolase [Tolumonas osonensis]MBB6054911.1 2-dehydro-3-deoxyphosphogluconate aldolase/(4S)-4-hydroxy-2-oxoglutarate aldolase [Tolumonas osonensis]
MNWNLSPAAIFAASPLVPVMVIDDLNQAVPMTQALAAGGITVYEVTLRTPAALQAIKAIREALPDALVGAGTVLNPQQYDAAVEAGAQFVISPGCTTELLAHAKQRTVPLIPGVATPSEIMTAYSMGYDHLKFFPAEANGGAPALKAISAPLPQIKFCPTGGISPKNVHEYLALSCVGTVGGSWMLPADALKQGDWQRVTQLSKEAVELVKSLRG